jgi:hypothetical protein
LHGRDALAPVALLHADVDVARLLFVVNRILKRVCRDGSRGRHARVAWASEACLRQAAVGAGGARTEFGRLRKVLEVHTMF